MIRYFYLNWLKFIKFVRWQQDLFRFTSDIEEYQRQYRINAVLLYHARIELGAEGWLKVLDRVKRQPTFESIVKPDVE